MRIDALRFKNLNSLAGEWSIDFQDPAFVAGGIFAITGATGAGKTTLLDALCLALFGRTPRLKTISAATNEIMTRGTGDCFAEATFTAAKGRYRCHWSQRRARRKADGRLQPPQHEIADDTDGRVLETKLRRVSQQVTTITGLDFERFTRSILLAQGGFAAFLQAGPDDRAPILEEITGTGIYSQISMAVHERLRQENTELERLQTLLEGSERPDLESEARLKAEEATLKERLTATRNRRQELANALEWLDQLAGLASALEALTREGEGLAAEAAAARPAMERLERAERAQPLVPDQDRLTALGNRLADNSALQDALRDQNNRLAKEIEQIRHRLASTEGRLEAARKALKLAEPSLKAARALDVKREAADRQVEDLGTACRNQEAIVAQAKRDHSQSCARLEESQAGFGAAQSYLEAHPQDAGLAMAMTGLGHLCEAQDKQRLALKDHAAAAAEARKAIEETEQRKSRALRAVERLKASAEALGHRLAVETATFNQKLGGRDLATHRRHCEQLLDGLHRMERVRELTERRETIVGQRSELALALAKLTAEAETATREEAVCRKEKALREQVVADKSEALTLRRRVADLESERRHLRAGSPCPLCGSVDHPWADEAPPAPGGAQLALDAAQAELAESEKQLQSAIVIASRAASKLEATTAKLAELALAETDIDTTLTTLALPAEGGGGPATAAELAQATANQRKALDEAREVMTAVEAMDQRLSAQRSELEAVRGELAAGEARLQKARFAWQAAGQEMDRLAAEQQSAEAALAYASERLLAELGPLGITTLPEEGAADLLVALERRREAYDRQRAAAEQWQGTIQTRTHKAELASQHLQQASLLLAQRQAELESAAKGRATLNQERSDLLGDKDPDQEETRLTEAVALAEREREADRQTAAALQEEAAATGARSQSLAEQGALLRGEVTALENRFKTALGAAGFRDPADLADARLNAAEMDHLAARRKSLADASADLAARRKDREKRLAKTRAKQVTTAPRVELVDQLGALDAEREQLQTRMGAISEQLAQIAAAEARQADILKRCERQSAVRDRWGRLHDLIGSADGKKFRVFAQGLTFEQVLAYANQELQKMSDRYIMVRDPEQPLNLLMADDYQGGVLRATDNLSGGESFLVSLALALGLAKMASRNVRLDSLFLDEGFGTLDEETLEIALDTLGGLEEEGKLIGVISHVATLKERIPVQIKVVSGNQGRSRLAGPGCRRHAGEGP